VGPDESISTCDENFHDEFPMVRTKLIFCRVKPMVKTTAKAEWC